MLCKRGTRKPTLQEKGQEGDEEDEEDRHDASTDPLEDREKEIATILSAKPLTRVREFADRELAIKRTQEYHCAMTVRPDLQRSGHKTYA